VTNKAGKFDCVFLVRIWDEAASLEDAQSMGENRWRGRIDVFKTRKREHFASLSELFNLIRAALAAPQENSD